MTDSGSTDSTSTGTTVRLTRSGNRWTIEVSTVVTTAVDQAWLMLTDTRAWPRWGPSVTAVELDETGPMIGPGVSGRVRTPVGFWLPFQIEECSPYRWTWRVGGVPATGHRVEPMGADRSRVVFVLPVWAPWYLPVVWLALRNLRRLLGDSEAAGRTEGADR